MSLMGALDLQELRRAADGLMPSTVIIYRRTRTSDGVGGSTLSPGTALGTYPCLAVPQGGAATEERAGREGEIPSWKVTVAANTPVSEKTDFLVVVNAGTFDIQSVNGPRSYEASRVIECTRR